MSAALKLVAEPRRQQILRLIWDQERAVAEIVERVDVSFGAVSQHLKKLREAGLVSVRVDGRRRLYVARRDGLGPLADYLEQLWAQRLLVLKRLAEAEENDHDEPH